MQEQKPHRHESSRCVVVHSSLKSTHIVWFSGAWTRPPHCHTSPSQKGLPRLLKRIWQRWCVFNMNTKQYGWLSLPMIWFECIGIPPHPKNKVTVLVSVHGHVSSIRWIHILYIQVLKQVESSWPVLALGYTMTWMTENLHRLYSHALTCVCVCVCVRVCIRTFTSSSSLPVPVVLLVRVCRCVHVCQSVPMNVSAGKAEQHHRWVRQGSAPLDRGRGDGGEEGGSEGAREGARGRNRWTGCCPKKAIISDFSICVFLFFSERP